MAAVEPLLKPFETAAPPANYKKLDASLEAFMKVHVPVEKEAGLRTRERVLGELKRIFQDWVRQVCRAKGLSDDLANEAGGRLYTSGSYRLGVHEPGADIDSVCVAPNHCTRTEFFDTLKAALLDHPDVTNLRSVETAVVPIMTFDFCEVNIDLLFAHLPLNAIPAHLDVDEDAVLQGVDEATEKSLNGPRVTNLIYKLVEHNYGSFLVALRVARVWAKKRGIYSNKMGYLGGVNFNILVALVCQLFPAATPSYLLTKFFHIFADWNWPSPAILCRPVDHGYGFEVWGQHADQLRGRMAYANLRNNLMPIVTPAYPAMNSSANVNAWSFAVLRDEFKRGSRICEEIVENASEDPLKLWAPLLERTDFFDKYDAYLAVNVLGGDEDSFNSFKGFLGSRLRKLVERLGYLPLRAIHLFPEEFERTTTEGLADYGGCWFLGIKEDVTRMEGETLILTHTWTEFWTEDVCKYRDLDDDLDVRLEHLTWEQLPDFVFGDDQDEVAVAKEVALERREVRHAREAEEEELLAVEEENPALKALKEAEENADAGTLKRAREEEAAEDEVKKPLAPTEARTLHDDADLPRLAAVLPPWHPLATTSRVPRSKKVQLELAS